MVASVTSFFNFFYSNESTLPKLCVIGVLWDNEHLPPMMEGGVLPAIFALALIL